LNSELIEKAARLIKNSKKTIALTGAGHSTPSGIPDFRSPGVGLWEKVDPVEVATIDSFIRRPDRFYMFMKPLMQRMDGAAPNPAHLALVEWENMGLLHSVVTQNIDNLHQRAGSRNVIELHGNGQRAFCMKCRRRFEVEDLRERLAASDVPCCDCGGVIKPDVILFGEQLPLQALVSAERDAQSCEVMIVVGSSLTVAPASMMPQIALQMGAKIIVVNLQATYIDGYAEVALHEKVEEALPAITERIKALG
jgi:NAD-dependent deacetylase